VSDLQWSNQAHSLDVNPNPQTLISEAKGDIKNASGWYYEALAVNAKHADSWTLLARLHASVGEMGAAQKKLEKIVKDLPGDGLANIMLGNIYFTSARCL
jgi:predicted TPR repeat methyltransferase